MLSESMENIKINLLINWFDSEKRAEDFEYCFERNRRLFNRVIILDGWPTYDDFFEIGNCLDGIKVIANLDIYFDDTVHLLKNVREGVVYCITRHEGTKLGEVKTFIEANPGTPGEYSQDVWVWTEQVDVDADFKFGIPGCDNHIAWRLNDAGYKILNPALDIRCIHVHNGHSRSDRRERVGSRDQYLKVDVTNLKMI